jgi:hypothetical protein
MHKVSSPLATSGCPGHYGKSGNMKKLIESAGRFGLPLMLTGMAITIVSLVMLIQYQYAPGIEKTLSIAGACTGIVVYLLGRIVIVLHRRRKKGPPTSSSDSSDEAYNIEDEHK